MGGGPATPLTSCRARWHSSSEIRKETRLTGRPSKRRREMERMSTSSATGALEALEAWLTSPRGIGAAGEYDAARVEAGAILETLALEYAKDPALRSLVPSPQPSGATEAMEVESEAGSATAEETDAEAIADEELGREQPAGYDDGDGDDASSSGSSPPGSPPVSEADDDKELTPQADDVAELIRKPLTAADVQVKLNEMFSAEAVVIVSSLLDALNADRPGLSYGSLVYQLEHLTKVLTEMNEEELLSFDGDNDFIFLC